MRVRALVVAVAALALLAACDGGAEEPLVAAPTPTPTPGEVRAYDGLEEIAEALDCKGLEDVGTANNPGLDEFGICYIGSANLDLYMTSQRGLWEHLSDLYPSVLGPNWIIVSPSGLEGARVVQERLGGELRVPPSPSPSKAGEAPAP